MMALLVYSMLKSDDTMQEKIVCSLNWRSGKLLQHVVVAPYIDDEIMHKAWKLIIKYLYEQISIHGTEKEQKKGESNGNYRSLGGEEDDDIFFTRCPEPTLEPRLNLNRALHDPFKSRAP
ncbi:hypothetical protein H5410_017171 [Solanum commersonii]|uniref:Uncharacterized protein n=1 Tax=Solanum commersonii TaxID=4109 RepID=A0A9J5ZZ79_SOLCO|nr:hypothetical protein H5410_017171 [Solanum commersonii]